MGSKRVQFLPMGRSLALHASALGMLFEAPEECDPFEVVGSAAVVDIQGPILQHEGGCWDSYDAIAERVKAAAASSAKAVVLRIDSPGGDALGVMECARELRGVCLASRKPLYAYVDGMACSAAYALASAAERILTPPAGVVGSVGVFMPLIDATAQDRAMGLSIQMVSSGARKLDGNPHVATTESALAETQRKVDGLAELFFSLVAEMRPGVTAASMRALEGATFLGAEAVSVGLADAVSSWSGLLEMVSGGAAKAEAATEYPMADEEKKTDETKNAMSKKAMKSLFDAFISATFPDEEKEGDKKEEAKAADADGDADGDKKAKAGGEETPNKQEKKVDVMSDEKKMAASVPASAFAALAGEVHSLKAKLAAKDEAVERSRLYASRPDFSPSQRATLDLLPLNHVKAACETWEKIPMSASAAANVQGTRGKDHTDDVQLTPLDAKAEADMDRAMGMAEPFKGISHEGGSLTLGMMTPEEAKAHLIKLKASNGAAKGSV